MKNNCGRQLTRSWLPATKSDLDQLEQKIMSAITDWADKEDADLSGIKDLLNSIATGVVALEKMITDFQNSPGTLSAADQARLDTIESATQQLRSLAAGISTAPPSPNTNTNP
jgi:hypothetical protein